jgi:ABC-type sulfate/molybdate transport systems ATPase subunit
VSLHVDLRAAVGGFTLEARFAAPGGCVALVGPNGAGKTTLLRVLAGAIRPTAGLVRVADDVLVDVAAGRFTPPEARSVGYLPQGYGLFEHLTARANVAYGLAAVPRPERERRTDALLASLGVAEVASRRPRALSGGERQRVALARALATRPRLLLLDEPLAALDVAVRRETRALLAAHLREASRITVVVTHDLRDLIAWEPLIVFLDRGGVADVGSLADLKARSRHPFLVELLGPLDDS